MTNKFNADTVKNNAAQRNTYSAPTCNVSIFEVEQNLLQLSNLRLSGSNETETGDDDHRFD